MSSNTRVLAVAAAFGINLVTSFSVSAADEFSVAEKRVFLDDHLKNIKHSGTLDYSFQQQSTKAEDTYDDKATVAIKEGADGKKAITVDYLSGTHKISLPDVGDAKGNPIVLHFLEMDVREMHRLVGGQEAYFRKRIRLALVDKAVVSPVKVSFNGKTVSASEVTIKPYIEDPLQDRFGKFYTKVYSFTISDQIPGGVYQIRTQVDDPQAPNASTPIMKTVLTLKGSTG